MNSSNAVRALAALAQENRLAIYRFLVRGGQDGAPAGTIAAELGIAGPNLSFHLKELLHAGLVRRQRSGRSILYRADFGTANDLVRFLMENCCRGITPRAQRARRPAG